MKRRIIGICLGKLLLIKKEIEGDVVNFKRFKNLI